MKIIKNLLLSSFMFLLTPIFAQQVKIKDIEEGTNFITTNIYSAEDDAKIFKL